MKKLLTITVMGLMLASAFTSCDKPEMLKKKQKPTTQQSDTVHVNDTIIVTTTTIDTIYVPVTVLPLQGIWTYSREQLVNNDGTVTSDMPFNRHAEFGGDSLKIDVTNYAIKYYTGYVVVTQSGIDHTWYIEPVNGGQEYKLVESFSTYKDIKYFKK